jgi:hypothetical protein
MIKKSALTFLVLFIGLSLFLFINKTSFKSTQYQYQGNVIKAQKYLYSDSIPALAMVGTSLSVNLNMDSLPGVYNLSMPGLSLFDGLNIISSKQALPAIILIEANSSFKPASANFTNAFNFKPFNFLKAHLVALRDENQPVGITLHYIKSLHKTKATPDTNATPAHLFEEMVQLNKDNFNHTDTSIFRTSQELLFKKVQEITDRGTKVCFFEMPVNKALQHLPGSDAMQENIINHFKSNLNVFFIPSDIDHSYKTTDGVHLNPNELLTYIHYLRTSLHNLSLL